MRMIHKFAAVTVCVVLFAASSLSTGQPEIVVDYPVTGLLARTFENAERLNQLGVANLGYETWSMYEFFLTSPTRPLWSNDSQSLALSLRGSGSGILDIQTNTLTPIADIASPFQGDRLSIVQGWSMDDQSLMFKNLTVSADASSNVVLYDVDITTNVSKTIYQWQSNTQLTDLPLPPNAISITLDGYGQAERNPIYDNWLLIQLTASGYFSDVQTSEPINGDTNVLWNYETEQGISLDALVPDLNIWPYRSDWSRDGKKLLLNASTKDLRENYILTFHFIPEAGATLVERAVVENRIAEHWLDAGDIFFSSVELTEDKHIYVLGEIVDGEYRELPFFTLQGDAFEASTLSDWLMLADEEERNRHSCLFDRALPAQLALGNEVSVIAEEVLPLRVAPDRLAEQITTLNAGATITVIGSAACSGGYRWWQVELTEGIIGWVSEADASDYFLKLSNVSTP